MGKRTVKITVNNKTNTIRVQSTGARGPRGYPGLVWIDDSWDIDIDFYEFDAIYHNGSSYRAIADHTSSLDNEPGTGASWQSVWEFLSIGIDADPDSINIVAGIANDVVIVANNAPAIISVAAIDEDIVNVANNIPSITITANNISAINTVADIDGEVLNVSNIANSVLITANNISAINTVADIDEEIVIVANAANDVVIIADNIDDILAAPGYANTAQSAANSAQLYANNAAASANTALGAANSAQVYANNALISANNAAASANAAFVSEGNAANSAALALAATLVEYGVSIYKIDGVETGVYYAERNAAGNSKMTSFYAEIINGDVGSGTEIIVEVDGNIVHGPVTVEYGVPVVSTIDVDIAAGDPVNFVVSAIWSGEIVEIFTRMVGQIT